MDPKAPKSFVLGTLLAKVLVINKLTQPEDVAAS